MAFGVDDAIAAGLQIINKFIPNPEQREQAALELAQLKAAQETAELQADTAIAIEQAKTNAVEASNINIFISGWRPAAGWACVSALVYQMLLRPIFGWIMVNLAGWSLPPALETDTLMTLLFGMLGLGGYRMAEKMKGVASK